VYSRFSLLQIVVSYNKDHTEPPVHLFGWCDVAYDKPNEARFSRKYQWQCVSDVFSVSRECAPCWHGKKNPVSELKQQLKELGPLYSLTAQHPISNTYHCITW